LNTPILKPPSGEKSPDENQSQSNQAIILILSGIIVCLLLIIFFLIIKPSPNEKVVIAEKNSHPIQNQEVLPDDAKQELKESFNREAQIQWSIKKTQAEQENMPVWANKNYTNALKHEKQAETLKQKQQYSSAEESYENAIAIIETTLNEKDKFQNQWIEQAETLFKNKQYTQARDYFEKAKSIEISNDKIEAGIQKIKDRIAVNKLKIAADTYKKDNNLDKALETLEYALNIESNNEIIKQDLTNLRKKINNDTFKIRVSNSLNYLDQNNFNQALKELAKAKLLKPDDPVLHDLQSRIQAKSNSKAIKAYQQKGKQFENEERWDLALNTYEKMNKIDANIINGKLSEHRVKTYLEFNRKIDEIILKSERLQNNEILEQSRNTISSLKYELDNANNVLYPLEKTPKLKQKIETAEKLLSDASKEIKLTLISDEKTSVVIYRVGKFGQFKTKEILLRPGKYTIVGTRDNYRDVRKIVKLTSDQEQVDIYIECREKI
jgi:tetratricopeptide (TPR) repeat protein